jgi:hypothetical protein
VLPRIGRCVGCNIARRACRTCEESGVFLFGDVVDVILCILVCSFVLKCVV